MPAVWSQDAKIPPIAPDRIREIASGRERQVTILWAGELQIRIQSAGGQQMLHRDQYELVAWDGYTNASEILAACHERLQRAMLTSEAIELGDADEGAVARLKSEQHAIVEALKRIRPEAVRYHERADALLGDVQRTGAEAAQERHAIWRRLWPKMTNLAFALQDEQFQKLEEICRQIQRDSDTLVESYRNQEQKDVAGTVVRRLKAVLSNVEKAGPRLARLPDDALPAEVTAIPESLAKLREQSSSLQSVTGTRWLGKNVHDWFTERQKKVDEHITRLETLQRAVGGLLGAAEELAAWQATLTESTDADLSAVERQLALLEEKLRGEESRLGRQQADENVRYAMTLLVELRDELHRTRRGALLQILQRETDRCLEKSSSAVTPQAARQSSAELAAWMERWEALPKAEYQPSVQLQITRKINQLRAARMECAVLAARAGLEQLRRDLDRTLDAARAASIGQHRDQLQTWNAELEALRKELQTGIEASDGILPSREYQGVLRQAEAARRDIGCATALIEIQQDLSGLPTAVTSLDEWDRHQAILESLDKRARDQHTDCPPLQRLLTEIFAAIHAGQDALVRERPRIEFQQIRDDWQQQLTVLDAAFQTGSVTQSRREYQAAVSLWHRLSVMLQQTPALAETPSFKAQLQDAGERTRELGLQLETLVAERRREAGWQPLPLPGHPLAAPAPEDAVLRVEICLAQGQLTEAGAELEQLLASHPQPPWPARASLLKKRLDYREAMTREEAGALTSAQQAYETLAGNPVAPTVAAAARSAWRRIDIRRQRQNRDRQARVRTVLLGATLLPILAGSLVLVWRSSSGPRLRRARKQWEAAHQAALQGDWKQRDRHLRSVAETLAKLPENHPDASRLREQMGRPDTVYGTHTALRPVQTAAWTEDAALDAVLASADLQGVPVCLAWLRQNSAGESNQVRYHQVIQWLAEHLTPNAQMLPERLDQLATYADEVRPFVPEQTWPLLYAACARWWKGDQDEALALARSLPETQETLPGPGRLRLVLALCWWKTGRHSAALALLRLLQQDAQDHEVRAEAKRWWGILRAGRSPASRKDAAPSIASAIVSLLRH